MTTILKVGSIGVELMLPESRARGLPLFLRSFLNRLLPGVPFLENPPHPSGQIVEEDWQEVRKDPRLCT